MTVRELQDMIMELKKEKDICILAHAYQGQEILEVADYTGDSYGLSRKAAETDRGTVIMCGVRFMAETVKTLSPEKKVMLANGGAGCPMADQMDADTVRSLKEAMPDHAVVAYINTSTELKTVCDVCVTSSSAVRIVERMENDRILFVPDCNLGQWISEQVPGKEIKLVRGGCPTHIRITGDDVDRMRRLHPGAKVLVHPECRPEVVRRADYTGSTTGIMRYAAENDCAEYIIGTESSIVEHLQYSCPGRRFYPLSRDCVCHNMKLTTLMDVYRCVAGEGGEEIVLPEEHIKGARRCIDEMLRLGG